MSQALLFKYLNLFENLLPLFVSPKSYIWIQRFDKFGSEIQNVYILFLGMDDVENLTAYPFQSQTSHWNTEFCLNQLTN